MASRDLRKRIIEAIIERDGAGMTITQRVMEIKTGRFFRIKYQDG
jgi:hypothetical protein